MTSPPAATRAAAPAAEHPAEPEPLAVPCTEPADVPEHGEHADGQHGQDPRTIKALPVVAITGGILLAGIGFTGSYNTLQHLAEQKGFGPFSYAFPVGIDAGILVLLSLDLYLARKQMALPLLRWFAQGLTVATVAFNAAASGSLMDDPLAASMHGIIPVLFIAAVEAARHYIGRMANILAGHQQFGAPPLSRWLLAPLPTFRIWRRMRMWSLPDYQTIVTRQREITIHRQMLRKRYGRLAWRWATPADELLPIKMARFGLSVSEALEIPSREAEAERRRAEAAELREREAEQARELREAEAELRRLESASRIGAAKIAAEAEKTSGEARLKAARAEAENAAANELRKSEEALRVQEAQADAEVIRIRAQAELDAAKTRLAAEEAQLDWEEERRRRQAEAIAHDTEAEAARMAAQVQGRRATQQEEQARAEAEHATAEARLRTAESARRTAEADAANARADAERAEAERRAEEDRLRAAEAKRLAAEAELAAAEAADEARLGVPERDARRVARMIQATGGAEVKLQDICDALGVSQTTASNRRQRALEYLARKTKDGGKKAT